MSRLSSLSELSPEELRKLIAAASVELEIRELKRGGTGASSAVLDAWHRAIKEQLVYQGIQMPPASVWRKQVAGGQALKPHVAGLEKLVRKFFRKEPRAIEIHPARVLVACCLLTYMKKCQVLISPGSVCRNIGNASAAVQSEFPDYCESGLLPLVLKRLQS
jgi:hypothetical protein